MAGIDESKPFVPINISVLTVSDTRDIHNDTSGDALCGRISDKGHRVYDRRILPDDQDALREQLAVWCANRDVDAIITTGGTGVTGRDVTVEAHRALYEKEIPGFGELFRWISYQKIGTSTVQSRATAGVCKGTYLFALPGSTGACKDAWDEILFYQLDIRHRPCNFVELMPRLLEK
ncbi:molybdenum cofactor biosynthesis protein B [Thalassospira sp.]|uniref:molybdenum cofactor biosynthesis protein B n=1 Tax=Thalassospira sp. TaxID=1912094 RepID=UPI003AA99BAC